MSAGELRHRITIQNCTVTQNDHGQDETTWTNYASRVPARVFEEGSREFWTAQQTKADITALVKLRWMAGVLSKMRVIWHDGATDRTLGIEGPPINPDGKREYMHLMCKEAG